MNLAGFGNYPRIKAPLARLRDAATLRDTLTHSPSLIARGNGRSYGDAALNATLTLSTLQHDRILAFDDATGELTCEAGLLLADLIAITVPRGWFPRVTPGTQYVTIGGMIAADVHGKNHHVAGSMRDCLVRFTLMKADGDILTCSPTENAEIFAATCGGMGLTGVILTATLMLQKIETATIRQRSIRTRTLAETMETFEAHASTTYSVAWIDCLARGKNLGRSVVFLGEHTGRHEIPQTEAPLQLAKKRNFTLPFNLPSFTLNRYSIRAFNALYYAAQTPGEQLVDLTRFFYPLDAIHHWNRLYGGRGFVQYQCVFPKAHSAAALTTLLEQISAAGLGSFLAVLKLLGPGHDYLSFPMEGYTLALDFPATAPVFALLDRLDALVAEQGGRIYLAKDARLTSERLAQFYPGLDAFRRLRHSLDSAEKFASLQSKRLGL